MTADYVTRVLSPTRWIPPSGSVMSSATKASFIFCPHHCFSVCPEQTGAHLHCFSRVMLRAASPHWLVLWDPTGCVSMGHKPIVIKLKSVEWRCSSLWQWHLASQSLQPSCVPIVLDGLSVTLPLACIQEGPVWEGLILAASSRKKYQFTNPVTYCLNGWVECPQDVVPLTLKNWCPPSDLVLLFNDGQGSNSSLGKNLDTTINVSTI